MRDTKILLGILFLFPQLAHNPALCNTADTLFSVVLPEYVQFIQISTIKECVSVQISQK